MIWVATAANLIGPQLVTSLESATTLLGLAPVAAIGSFGWWWFQPDLFARNWDPAGTPVAAAVPASLTLMFWAFTGVESAAVATAIVRNPQRNVALATLFGVLLAAILYVASTTVVFGIVPVDRLAASPAPFEEVVRVIAGPGPALILALCAMLKSFGALGGWTLLVAESGRVAATDGLFAGAFGRVNRRGVPVAGLLIVAVLMTLIELVSMSPTIGALFNRLVSISTLLIIPAYLFSAVALALSTAESGSMRLIGFITGLVMIYIASTATGSDAVLTVVLVFATAPLFVVNRRLQAGRPDVSPGPIPQ